MPDPEPRLDIDVVFLGGIFLPEQLEMIQQNSRGVVQNAADALQKGFLEGLAQNVARLRVVNLPFVGSYPRAFRRLWFPASDGQIAGGVPVRGIGFLNLQYAKLAARTIAAAGELRAALPSAGRPTVVMVYSAHLPFLVAARLARWRRPGTHLCAILPDLPEFMGEGGWLYRAVKATESSIFRRLIGRFDSFVFLTEATGERLGVPPDRRIVIEGIYMPGPEGAPEVQKPDDPPAILYTGTLAARYGIGDLLAAFEILRHPTAQLWICGDGDSRGRVEEIARINPRVRYFGQVPRAQALDLQRRAAVLVNPRRPEGEFTKYSFPSKTMEYLASARPVVMHALPGIPREYLDHMIVPQAPDPASLALKLDYVLSQSEDWRDDRGRAGRRFVENAKSPEAQVARLVQFWKHTRKLL